MANAKSNIYPIQLQGAELCLNRYDAEIKQYRGFNKNNSPFVGGCLSNVFTKEGQIEGGNGKTTYIDEDGTIYKVTTDGFYQNDNKLINYNEYVKFYKKTKLFENRSVVYAVSDKIYIDIQGDCYYAHWGDGYSENLGSIRTEKDPHLNIEYKDGIIVFTYKRYKKNGDWYAILNTIIVPNENEEPHYKAVRSNPGDTSFSAYVCIPIGLNLMADNNSRTYPQGVYINTSGEMPEILIAWNEDGGNAGYQDNSYYGLNRFYINPDYQQSGGVMTSGHASNFTNNLEANLFSRNVNAYYMTNDGVFHFTHLLYSRNSPYTNGNYTVPSISAGNYHEVVCSLKLRFVRHNSNPSYDVYEISDTFMSVKLNYTLSGLTLRNNDRNTYYCHGTELNNNYFSNYAILFTTMLCDTTDTTKVVTMSFADNLKNCAILARDYKDPYAGCGFYGDFKLLINNGEISNISVCNYQRIKSPVDNFYYIVSNEDSLHGAILEDWNVIENLIIPSSGDRIVYKIGNIFYQIERGNPELSLKNNQLVINCNSELNAFSLDTQEVLHFASDWNGSLESDDIRYPDFSIGTSFGVDLWLGAAINEYDEKYNPSIILNAQQVIVKGYGELPYFTTVKQYYYKCAVNFYYTVVEGSSAPIYTISACLGSKYNDKLFNLPFPNNTDGNVQYNPNLFSEFINSFGIDVFVKNNKNVYQLIKQGADNIMAFFLGTLVEGLEEVFIIQGQYYGIINNQIFAIQFYNGVVSGQTSIVSVANLQFVGNTPYEALFFSKTNRCLYSFTGANVLNQKQFVDKISEVRNYLYNPATQTVFLITDIGVLFYSLFGMFLLEYTDITNIFLLDNGIVMGDNSGNYHYVKYYLDEGDTDYEKQNIRLETSFYGMNNEMVTINDCLYFRIFSEEHEEGDLKVSATTISLSGRKTEETTFKIKASDWDKITHTIYMRYQPKTQRGLGVSFSIDSPFKIASLSVGSQPDAILVDKVSKVAITAPSVTTNNDEW